MFEHLKQAEALALGLGDRLRLGWVSAYLAACYFNSNKASLAEEAARRAFAIGTEREDFALQVMGHFFLGLTYLHVCKYRESITSLRWNVEALKGDWLHERFGEPGLPAVCWRMALISSSQQARGRLWPIPSMSSSRAPGMSTFALSSLAWVARIHGDMARAGRLLGAADALFEAIGQRRLHSNQVAHAAEVTLLRAALGEQAFAAAWVEGQAMTLQQATTYALEGSALS